MTLARRISFFATALLLVSSFLFAGEPAYRTDGGSDKLPWYQIKSGEFPPENSAHAFNGELIGTDHINRTGVLRVERTDAIPRSEWDRALAFTLLPYGTIRYHGAPAELRDIPIGTHLHGQFYSDDQGVKDGKNKSAISKDTAFKWVFKLEDDLSYYTRLQHAWRIDAIDTENATMTVSEINLADKKAEGKAKLFSLPATARVWKGHAIAALTDLAVGQSVQLNLTVCTLKGPGRVTEVWLDTESTDVAAAHQLEMHRQYVREHGLPGFVDEVDNKEGIVSVVLFAGFDPKLKDDFPVGDVINAIVAEDSLRTYDQINDKKSGPITEVLTVPAGPGNSGVRIKFKPNMLLEGYRPKKIIRILSSKWKLDDLPREERIMQ